MAEIATATGPAPHEFETRVSEHQSGLRGIARFLVANERRKQARHSRLLPFAVVDALLEHEPESGRDQRRPSVASDAGVRGAIAASKPGTPAKPLCRRRERHDARGTNQPQRSFIGIAFHGVDDRAYDEIYFRPFNFKAADPVRRQRAVQYISHPAHTWRSLREQIPGKYESAVEPAPNPDGWFHARIVVAWPKVSVFVNGASEPCLVLKQLRQRKRGWVALCVDVSGGDFANLRISHAKQNGD
jgi:hypothetical protein